MNTENFIENNSGSIEPKTESKVENLGIDFQPQEVRDLILQLVKDKGGDVDTGGVEMGWSGPQATSDWIIPLAKHLGINNVDAFDLKNLLDNFERNYNETQKNRARYRIRSIISGAK
jgi:hypothetical protein